MINLTIFLIVLNSQIFNSRIPNDLFKSIISYQSNTK